MPLLALPEIYHVDVLYHEDSLVTRIQSIAATCRQNFTKLDFDPERPTVVESLLRVHRDALGYSDADLVKLLHYFESDIRKEYRIGADKPKRARIAVLK